MISLKNKIVLGAAVIAAALLYSCSGGNEEKIPEKELIFKGYHYSLDTILKTKEGIIHNIELGEKLNDVKSKEPKKPDEMDVDYCLYNYKIDSISNYSVAYNFVGDSLDEIEVQINSTSLDNGTVILNAIKKYYSDKYTAPLMDKGVYVFSCFDSKKRNFMITISDNSTSETGIINLLIYREK